MTERFTLLTELGRGGMGVVWKARDEETGQIVALKLLRETYAEDPDYLARFERELELAKRIHSRNVVAVLGYGVRDKTPYLALEYIDGQSLRERLATHGAYSWTEARPLLAQIAQGLADAHAAGVVHRDLKPSNVLIGSDGVAKLADFGIAKGLDLTRMTGTSTLLGTPAYLPPEGPNDERSDLYSLGCIAYEMLTGVVPFEGRTYQEVILRHVRETPNLERLPEEARPIIGWLLAKDAGDRPQRVGDLLPVLWGGAEVPVGKTRTEVHAPALPTQAAQTGPRPQPGPAGAASHQPTVRPAVEKTPPPFRPPSPTPSVSASIAPSPSGVTLGRASHLYAASSAHGSGRHRRKSAPLFAGLGFGGLMVLLVVVSLAGALLRSSSLSSDTNPTSGPTPTATAELAAATPTPTRPPIPAPSTGTFSSTGSMTTVRFGHTATLLSDGRVLITGGGASSAELYDPKTGTFSPTGSMATARSGHTATLLSDGRVLLAGGKDANSLASAELYDPKTGTFSPTGSMGTARDHHNATLLSDGRVLIAGGYDGRYSQSSAELYDPSAGKFRPTGYTLCWTWCSRQTATRLSDGRVLIAGGNDLWAGLLASAQLYDPTTDTFSPTGSMATARSGHTATRLPDGLVLIAGGVREASAELYNPKTGAFSATGSMTTVRSDHAATLLVDGRVLIVGGEDGAGAVASAQLYDPATGTFSPTGSMATVRFGHTATLLSDGRVLLAGGSGDTSAEIYTP